MLQAGVTDEAVLTFLKILLIGMAAAGGWVLWYLAGCRDYLARVNDADEGSDPLCFLPVPGTPLRCCIVAAPSFHQGEGQNRQPSFPWWLSAPRLLLEGRSLAATPLSIAPRCACLRAAEKCVT